jgi:hypothetical protein
MPHLLTEPFHSNWTPFPLYNQIASKSEDEKRSTLAEKYPELLRANQQQKQQMQTFFDNMKDPTKAKEQQEKFDKILRGGKVQGGNKSGNAEAVAEYNRQVRKGGKDSP